MKEKTCKIMRSWQIINFNELFSSALIKTDGMISKYMEDLNNKNNLDLLMDKADQY